MEITIRQSVPRPRSTENLGRSATFAKASKAKEAAGGDADALFLAATQASKNFDMNRHFIMKKMKNNPDLVAAIKQFIETDVGKGC